MTLSVQINFDDENKYVTNTSMSSYFCRLLISISTAFLICALFDLYQLEVGHALITKDPLLLRNTFAGMALQEV